MIWNFIDDDDDHDDEHEHEHEKYGENAEKQAKMNDLEQPIPARELLPHREPMLLIDTLTAWQPDLARASAQIAAANPFVDRRGRLGRVALIEMLAQTAAAHKGYEARKRGTPADAGFLVGLSDFVLREEVRVGDTLRLEVRQTLALERTVVLAGEILRGEQSLGGGGLKVWQEPALPAPAPREPAARPGPDANRPALDPRPWAEASPMRRALLERLERYQWLADENRVVGDFFFDDDFLGFRGHFPGYPLLAGILMLELAKTLCVARLGAALQVTRVDRVKISRQVLPGDRVRAEIKLAPAATGYTVKAILSHEAQAVASLAFGIELE